MSHALFLRKKIYLCIFLSVFTLSSYSQSVADLSSGYTGKTEWDASSKTLTFVTTGEITFPGKNKTAWLWEIPSDVSHIIIGENVRVTGAFHSKKSVSIIGENRKTSVVYGTPLQKWADNNGIKAYTICTFQNFGGTMTIKNLTSLNPFGFHVRGWGTKMMVSYCDFLDDRGGNGNHSDGVEGGDGSVFDHCYFETGDDIFKVYFDILVTNCTVQMVQNTVPIQLGWGNYSNGAVGTFRNLTINGNSGRGAVSNAIINGRTGTFNVTVNIDSVFVNNPNAAWVTLNESTTGLKGTVTHANIKIKTHAGKYMNGPYDMTICGTKVQLSSYDCFGASGLHEVQQGMEKVYPNPAKYFVKIEGLTQAVEVFDARGCSVDVYYEIIGNSVVIAIGSLQNGLYFAKCGNVVHKFLKIN